MLKPIAESNAKINYFVNKTSISTHKYCNKNTKNNLNWQIVSKLIAKTLQKAQTALLNSIQKYGNVQKYINRHNIPYQR